jgi:hypothetical protein
MRKQLNIRVDDETEARVRRLLSSVRAALGLPVSQSDLFRLGMIELEKKFPPAAVSDAATSCASPGKKEGKRPRKNREGSGT